MCLVSNYIPRYRKKRDILAKREQELIRVLKRGDSSEKVVAAVEEVRAAQIRVINAERARVPGREGYERHLANLDAESSKWMSMSVEEIISLCLKRIPGGRSARLGPIEAPGESAQVMNRRI
jgi:hypothetical protein